MGPLRIDVDLVRELLAEQHPDLSSSTIEPLAEGWDNAIFRLGRDLTVRLPRRIESAALILHEQRWVPGLVADLSPDGLATSSPLRTGRPGCGFPWSWSVGPWLPGTIAAAAPPDDPFDAGARLGALVATLHQPAPAEAPTNPYRGVALDERTPMLTTALDRLQAIPRDLGAGITRQAVEARWAELVGVPAWEGPPLWLHGDLHLANLLVHDGRLSAVIDFGDVTSGDPATDLSVAWPLLPEPARATFRSAAGGSHGIDDATWARAEAWALALAVAYLAGSAVTSPLVAVARHTLSVLLLDPA